MENNPKFPDSKQKEWGKNTEEGGGAFLFFRSSWNSKFPFQPISSLCEGNKVLIRLDGILLFSVVSPRLFCFVESSHKMAILHIVIASFKTVCPFHTKQNRFIKAMLSGLKVIEAS